MTKGKILASLLALGLQIPATAHSATPSGEAADLLHQALRQMGGEDKLKALRTIHFQATGYRNALEQSERPEGPYIVEYDQISESRDFEHRRWKQETEMRWQVQPSVKLTITVADDAATRSFNNQPAPASRQQVQQAEE